METIKDLIKIISNYQKITEITSGKKDEELVEVINVLKLNPSLKLDELKGMLEGRRSTLKKLSPKAEAIYLGELYYQRKRQEKLSEENELLLNTYLAIKENKGLQPILAQSLEEGYKIIHQSSEKSLTSTQLFFLGMALLKIKLKGSTKAEQRKNLLDIIWNVVENQKMNEIYESRL